uniref:Uncharacterized protein n=1 Tax=Anguilla anguilla TaxID=7936 RepID=A0A0E9U4C0_ANGAN
MLITVEIKLLRSSNYLLPICHLYVLKKILFS